MSIKTICKIITISVLVIIIIAILLLFIHQEDIAKLELVGQNTIVIDQYNEYMEPGYNIIGNNKNGFYVNVDGKVDVMKEGTYYLKYSLYNKNGNLVSSSFREVIVKGSDNTNISIYLIGDDEEYYFINDYHDNGAEAYQEDINISNSIITDSDVVQEKIGTYYVKYSIISNNKTKEVVRKVNIIDYKINKLIDESNSLIKLTIDCDKYAYVLLPNGNREYSKEINYYYDKENIYTFDIYLKNGSHKTYVVNIQ